MKRDPEDAKNLSRRDFVKTTSVGVGAAALTGFGAEEAEAQARPTRWDKEADIVVVGAGATGLPAAIEAAEHGASVIMIDANFDVGGHAILSGGNVAIGGGTSLQKKYGIEDSADTVFRDLTDWTVVEPNGFPSYRYNDREIIRAYADNSAPTYEWLVAHGVTFVDEVPDNFGANAVGNSALREHHVAPMGFEMMHSGKPEDPAVSGALGPITKLPEDSRCWGVGLVRPLEAAARKAGVQIFLKHRMSSLIREQPLSGRTLGIKVTSEGKALYIRGRKGVILGTGGSTSNVNFRRIFDPRLTEEYISAAGEPYSFQDASGELAALAIGASLWGTYNQTGEFGYSVIKAGRIGCQDSYNHLEWLPGSPVFHLARARGLNVRDYQNLILVNQAGLRFYDELQGQFTTNRYHSIQPYTQGSYLNVANVKFHPANFLNAALAGTGEAVNGGGPIWAIFDADAVKREQWTVEPPFVDIDAGLFFSANTVAALAAAVGKNRHMRKPIPGAALETTVARYNSFVDQGKDADFAKPSPKYKIATPPFYAAWATPILHDTRTGLRINAKCQVVDLYGNVIPGLYCGGESAGGFSMHGLARCVVQGRIAGINAAKDIAKA
jgi:succinate dehydrogenase/fumarate reductase flavoprotein subunit